MAENIKTNAKKIINLKIRQSPTTIHRRALIKQMITDYFFTKKLPQTMLIQYSAAIYISKEWQIATVKTTFITPAFYQEQNHYDLFYSKEYHPIFLPKKLTIYFMTK